MSDFQRMRKGKGLLAKERPKSAVTERDEAKKVNGKRQPRSGATPWAKEDIINKNFLFQHKDASKQKGHRIDFEAYEELRRNAIDEGKDPCYWIKGPYRDLLVIDIYELK